jgi:PAS domain S-box-containing protein
MDNVPKPDPKDRPAKALRAKRLSLRSVVLLFGLSVVLMGGCLLGLWTLRQEEQDDERENLQRLALTLSEQTALAFREIDFILRETRSSLKPEMLAGPDLALHKLLRERFLGLPQGQALLVFGADGRMLAHSREYPTPKVSSADRDYFVAQKPVGDALFISAPLRNRVNKRWMISLSRRLSTPEGGFAGVVMAAVEMDYFSDLYRSLNLQPRTRLELCRTDGILLTSSPYDEELLGRPVQPERHGADFISATSAVPTLPLYMRLTLPRSVALENWRRHMYFAGAGLLAILAGVAALTLARRAHMRQLQQSEQALRESETRYRTFVETAGEGICAVDAALVITYVNRVTTEMLGYQEREMLGRSVLDFLAEGPDAHMSREELWRHSQRGRQELRLVGKSGAEVWAIVSSAPLRGPGGEEGGSFAMLTDITQRKQAEKFREGIESVLRHDLRSPLASMSYIPQMLLAADNLDEQQRWSVEEMQKYVRKMLRMVDAYLKLSNIERDRFQLEARELDLVPLLEDVEQELRSLLQAGRKRVALLKDGAPLAPGESVVVQGEAVLCQTMFGNLLKNALEAAPDDTAVEIDLRERAGRVEIAMRNLGAVPESVRGRFFQKYVTAGKSRGTGLGAYSARLIAEAHGGTIALDTTQPGATTVRVTLPKPG